MTKLHRKKSALTYVLLALIPYTKNNSYSYFKPNIFFNELEKDSGYSISTLRVSFSRAKDHRLIIIDGNNLSISLKGRQIIQPFIANQLESDGQLMVIFDIPEDSAELRRKFRLLLRQLGFSQIQQSVWMSIQDHQQILIDSINDLGLQGWVQLYKSNRIY
ncbi:MAG TPA: CRISPR-associated endonuclease Cas2 [Candidatus Saccharibacteria bacterium]|nr:CRISPR-associated endonuclease Cas2 [Candidatus Saccharibacteria bacterium]